MDSPLLFAASNREQETSTGDILRQAEADRWRLRKDKEIVFCSLTPVVVMVVKNLVNAIENGPNELLLVIEFVIIGFTLIAAFKLMQYYRQLLILKRAEWNKSIMQGQGNNLLKGAILVKKQQIAGQQSYRFLKSSLFPKLCLELLIHAFMPNGLIDRQSYAHKLLELAMFSRLYLLLRLLHTSSSAFLKRERINAYYADFRRMNMKVRWHLTLKMLFYDHSFVACALLVLLVVFTSGFGIYILERHIPLGSFSSIKDCLWFSFVTFTTIGYGDLYPDTQSGRLIACLCGVFGHIIVAMFGGVITNKLAPTKNQQLITVFLENQQAGSEYRNAAAKLIQNVWRETSKLQQELRRLSSIRPGAATAAVSFADGGVSTARKLKEKFNFTHHKRNRVYAAVKLFRSRRQLLAKAQLSAVDPVVDQKLDTLQDMISELINMNNNNNNNNSDHSRILKRGLNSGVMIQPFSSRRSVKFPGSFSFGNPATTSIPPNSGRSSKRFTYDIPNGTVSSVSCSTTSVRSFRNSDDSESNCSIEREEHPSHGYQSPPPEEAVFTPKLTAGNLKEHRERQTVRESSHRSLRDKSKHSEQVSQKKNHKKLKLSKPEELVIDATSSVSASTVSEKGHIASDRKKKKNRKNDSDRRDDDKIKHKSSKREQSTRKQLVSQEVDNIKHKTSNRNKNDSKHNNQKDQQQSNKQTNNKSGKDKTDKRKAKTSAATNSNPQRAVELSPRNLSSSKMASHSNNNYNISNPDLWDSNWGHPDDGENSPTAGIELWSHAEGNSFSSPNGFGEVLPQLSGTSPMRAVALGSGRFNFPSGTGSDSTPVVVHPIYSNNKFGGTQIPDFSRTSFPNVLSHDAVSMTSL